MSERKIDGDIKISIANCAGRSNIGQMSFEIAKKIDKALPYANINCLPAIYPDLKPAKKFYEADAVVIIMVKNLYLKLKNEGIKEKIGGEYVFKEKTY